MHTYFVRIGSLAEVHAALSPLSLPRGRRVIVRTPRGVEVGVVISRCQSQAPTLAAHIGPLLRIVRPTTEQDELLIGRLSRHRREAVEACRGELARCGSSAILLDVDQLFDGGTLILHFLGPVDALAESVRESIVQRYEAIVRTRQFAQLLQEGCGEGCGTDRGGGCGAACSGCEAACHTR
jgi:hypothetical protein